MSLSVRFSMPFEALTEPFDRFFLPKPQRELFEPGLERGATIAPVQTLDDLLEFDQLAARDYFAETRLPSGQRVKAPGPFARSSDFEFGIRPCAFDDRLPHAALTACDE